MIRIPPYLRKGDTIGMVCPAGYLAPGRSERCIETLEQWGYRVVMGSTVHSSSANYFAGTDDERLADLQRMLDDDSVAAILCGRGGYGVSRIIDRLDLKRFRHHPKWIVGFSDITLLHAHLYAEHGIATLHASMAGAFAEAEPGDKRIHSLRRALEGKKISYKCDPHAFNRKGEAVGELVGGNLALLAHAIGTPSDIKTKGRILFIEDVGEFLYNIDRMLQQLRRAGKFDKLAGLIVGGFTDMKDTERPFGQTVQEIIRDAVADFSFPVCFDFPVSHGKDNLALKIGAGYKLKVAAGRVTLEE